MRKTDAQEMSLSTSLDSFLDIITNVLGLLILICAMTIISSRDVQISLGTPIMAEVDDDLDRVCFECRGNRLLPLDDDFRRDEIKEILESDISSSERRERIAALSRASPTNGFHRFELELREIEFLNRTIRGVKMTITPVDEPVGDTLSQLRRPQSELSKRLSKMNPRKHWLYFIVRTDSFEAFRAARKHAKKQGFQVGWTPHKPKKPIVFSPFGSLGKDKG